MSTSINLRWSRLCLLGVLELGLALSPLAHAVDSFQWDAQKNRMSAEVGSWPLARLLEIITETTGWEVFVEPTADFTSSAKFKNLPLGEGLRALLGNLNYALVPQTNAPARLYVFQTTMKAATQRVTSKLAKARPDGTKPIPNELIVTVKPGTDINALARSLGAKVIGRVDGLNTYRLQFDSAAAADAALAALNANPEVVSVDYNFELPKPDPLTVFGGGVPDLPITAKAIGADGVVTVGLVDTGGDFNSYCGMSGFMMPGINVTDTAAPTGTPTHGPSMAYATIRGFSMVSGSSNGKAVRILPVDVYGAKPTTTTFDVANGIYRAVNAGANPINLSLGTSGDSAFLRRVIQNAAAQGVIFFAAAGNEPVATPTYPAAYSEVIAVTAGDRQGHIASYANFGSFVDAMAPGTSAFCYNGESWVSQGTSVATAYASGLAAGAAALGASSSQAASAVTTAMPVGSTK